MVLDPSYIGIANARLLVGPMIGIFQKAFPNRTERHLLKDLYYTAEVQEATDRFGHRVRELPLSEHIQYNVSISL